MADLEVEHWWFLGRRRILKSVLDRLELPADSALLEAGCGTGGNFPLLSQYGSLTAFEPDERARKRAEARNAARVISGHLPGGVPVDSETFDLIVLLDVLEHVGEDEAALRTLRHLLKPKGTVLLTVPAYSFLWTHHDDVLHHKRRYRRSALERLARAAGFAVTHSTYFNTLLFPAIAAVRLYHSFVGCRGGSDLDIPSPVTNAVLEKIFASERMVVPHMRIPFGVSILMTLQR